VVGHGEYRRVTNLEPQFRRCFAEVFRQRSFLFLGSSLSEEYFLNLFGEILEIYGSNPWPHFAFARQGETDARFLLERMNISVCEHRDHDELPGMLDELEKSINGSRCRPTSWTFGLNESPVAAELEGSRKPRLTIRRSSLPKLPLDRPTRKECVAVSVGRRDSRVHFGSDIRGYLEAAVPNFPALRAGLRVPVQEYTARLGNTPYYAVAARNPKGMGYVRDLRAIRAAMDELLDRVRLDGFERVHLQLLSAGAKRTFPSLYSFTEMVRAFGAWSRRNPGCGLHVLVYVMDATVLSQLSAGAVNVHELLSCPLIRFWAEIDSDERASMRMTLYYPGKTRIAEIMTLLGLPATNGEWKVTVHPPPMPDIQKLHADHTAELTLEEAGIVPGSTLRFTDLRHTT
jgi:hypothetical protein